MVPERGSRSLVGAGRKVSVAAHTDQGVAPRTRLTRERVLLAAVDLADRGGVEALSMRKLGQALGVEAMSLYNHVANKGALVSGMVDRVVEQFELPDDEPRWDK